MKQFDYVIAGAGAAGLTLAYLLMGNEDKEKSILIIDKDSKSSNDRTWCFWETGTNLLENIVHKTWTSARIKTSNWQKDYPLDPYKYKMIRGIDFYEFMKKELQKPNISWLNEEVIQIEDDGRVLTMQAEYQGNLVFSSLYDPNILHNKKQTTLLQHFKGQVIRVKEPAFDVQLATYMDFSLPQEGDCRFGYVLPFDDKTALVEYTLFNQKLLSDDDYDSRLKAYIKSITDQKYEVLEEEFGIIPMTDYPFQTRQSDKVFNIGINGGFAKPSTGYTFLRGQKILKKMADNIDQGLRPDYKLPYQSARFKKYDATLLKVLNDKQFTGEDIFGRLFEKNGIHAMFKFLDEETSLTEELKIMSTTPLLHFGKAFMHQTLKK